MGKLVGYVALVAVLLFSMGLLHGGAAIAGGGQSDWKAEFDALCGRSENSMTMTVAELKSAVEKCDALQRVIEGLEPTPRKVYLKRLQMCRNLLAYMLDSRLKEERK